MRHLTKLLPSTRPRLRHEYYSKSAASGRNGEVMTGMMTITGLRMNICSPMRAFFESAGLLR